MGFQVFQHRLMLIEKGKKKTTIIKFEV